MQYLFRKYSLLQFICVSLDVTMPFKVVMREFDMLHCQLLLLWADIENGGGAGALDFYVCCVAR